MTLCGAGDATWGAGWLGGYGLVCLCQAVRRRPARSGPARGFRAARGQAGAAGSCVWLHIRLLVGSLGS